MRFRAKIAPCDARRFLFEIFERPFISKQKAMPRENKVSLC